MPRLILNPKNAGDIAIKGIIFDMDGTLCLPQVSSLCVLSDLWRLISRLTCSVGAKDELDLTRKD